MKKQKIWKIKYKVVKKNQMNNNLLYKVVKKDQMNNNLY